MTGTSPAVLLSRKKRRKKMFRRVLFIFLAVFILLVAAFVGVFRIEKFKIKNIIVSGNHVLETGEIENQIKSVMAAKTFGIIPRDRIFSFSAAKAESALESRFGRLNFVEVKKRMPADIEVTVSEREPFVLLCLEGSKDCFFTDETGFIFEEAPFFSSGVFIKFFDRRFERPGLGRFLISRESMERVFSFLDKVDSFFSPEDVYLNGGGVYEFQTADGFRLILDESDDWNLSFSNLETFLSGYKVGEYPDFDYIDLRFGNKVFYKIK